jgi:hypothetical protein
MEIRNTAVNIGSSIQAVGRAALDHVQGATSQTTSSKAVNEFMGSTPPLFKGENIGLGKQALNAVLLPLNFSGKLGQDALKLGHDAAKGVLSRAFDGAKPTQLNAEAAKLKNELLTKKDDIKAEKNNIATVQKQIKNESENFFKEIFQENLKNRQSDLSKLKDEKAALKTEYKYAKKGLLPEGEVNVKEQSPSRDLNTAKKDNLNEASELPNTVKQEAKADPFVNQNKPYETYKPASQPSNSAPIATAAPNSKLKNEEAELNKLMQEAYSSLGKAASLGRTSEGMINNATASQKHFHANYENIKTIHEDNKARMAEESLNSEIESLGKMANKLVVESKSSEGHNVANESGSSEGAKRRESETLSGTESNNLRKEAKEELKAQFDQNNAKIKELKGFIKENQDLYDNANKFEKKEGVDQNLSHLQTTLDRENTGFQKEIDALKEKNNELKQQAKNL